MPALHDSNHIEILIKTKFSIGQTLNKNALYVTHSVPHLWVIWRKQIQGHTSNFLCKKCTIFHMAKAEISLTSSGSDNPCITCSLLVIILSYGRCYAITEIHRAHHVRCQQYLLHLCLYYGSLNHEKQKFNPIKDVVILLQSYYCVLSKILSQNLF